MIEITLDLGRAPSVLAAMSDKGVSARMAKAAAESYVDDIHDHIDAGKAFTTRLGQLQQSINWRPRGDGAEVFANADYAPFVEFGTRPHLIEPKPGRGGLKIPVSGGQGYIIRRSVNHPGSRPHPFFFADRDNRMAHMQERALSVLAAKLESI